jgi:hypothetical protein
MSFTFMASSPTQNTVFHPSDPPDRGGKEGKKMQQQQMVRNFQSIQFPLGTKSLGNR